MAVRSLHELNALLDADYRFFNHTNRDYSGNGNDAEPSYLSGGIIGGASTVATDYTTYMGFRGINCNNNYLTYPSTITGSFSIEFLGSIGNAEDNDYTDFRFLYDSGGPYFITYASADLGSAAIISTGTSGVNPTIPEGELLHFVYTREITSGPVLANQYAYINGVQFAYSGTSGTNDIAADAIFGYGNGFCFSYRIYNDYLTEGEAWQLFDQSRRSVASDAFFYPTYIPYIPA